MEGKRSELHSFIFFTLLSLSVGLKNNPASKVLREIRNYFFCALFFTQLRTHIKEQISLPKTWSMLVIILMAW